MAQKLNFGKYINNCNNAIQKLHLLNLMKKNEQLN